MGITNVDESKTKPLSISTTGKCYDNLLIKSYDKILKEICEENKLPFISVFGTLKNEDLPDGLHPNGNGQIKLFETIKKGLLNCNFLDTGF